MNEKQFNYIENKIKEAAVGQETPFDELSWKKMEALLDKNKDSKRPFFWIFIPLLAMILVAGYFFYTKTSNEQPGKVPSTFANNQIKAQVQSVEGEKIISLESAKKDIYQDQVTNVDKVNIQNGKSHLSVPEKQSSQEIVTTTKISKKKPAKMNLQENTTLGEENTTDKRKRKKFASKGKTALDITEGTIATDDLKENTVVEPAIPVESIVATIKDNGETDSLQNVKQIKSGAGQLLTKMDTVLLTENDKNKPTVQKQKKNQQGFYLLASLGAEASTVNLSSFKNSPVVPRYGIGVGYQISNKLAIQTGFYISSKKYIAGPGDYKPGADSYWNNVQIIKVDANCLVYEIPLTLRIDFLKSPATSFFGTIGMSSYIMKKEKYNYDYLLYNYPYQGKYDYTGNKSFFGLLSFSAGMEKKLNAAFSLMAEPSINIPLAGVGDGKVKLYTAGLQLGIKYHFRKK